MLFKESYKMYYKYEDLVESYDNLTRIVITDNLTCVVVMLGCDGKSFCVRLTLKNGTNKTHYEKCFYNVSWFNEFVKHHRCGNYAR